METLIKCIFDPKTKSSYFFDVSIFKIFTKTPNTKEKLVILCATFDIGDGNIFEFDDFECFNFELHGNEKFISPSLSQIKLFKELSK